MLKPELLDIDTFKSADECAKDLDTALDNLVFKENNVMKSRTCFCCDRLLLSVDENPRSFSIKQLEKCSDLFQLKNKTVELSDGSIAPIPHDVIQYYKYRVSKQLTWLENCVISPNSCFCSKKQSFLVCKTCYVSLQKKRYPKIGILNGYMIGTAPDIAQQLSYEEMSCISLVRNAAHIFTYMGGEDTTIKGWHSMVEVDLSDVQRTLRGMDHYKLGFPDSITVVLEGPMTIEQYKRVKKKAHSSRKKMLDVLKWYICNNYLYAKHFETVPNIRDIPIPKIIERVNIVDSVDTNIELTEQMSMVFPDDNLNETTGGFKSVDEFKEVISEINKGNTAVTVTSRASQYVYANNGENFVKGFPIQFPYGIGGPNEVRVGDDDEPIATNFVKYIQHVNNLSNLNFHTQLFCVLSWNILEKQDLLRRACLRIKNDKTLQKKIAETTSDEVAECIMAVRKGHVVAKTTKQKNCLFDTVNSVAYSLPHSNENANKNRKYAFSMQLRFGMPFVFFTLTPDDSVSYTVSVYLGLQFKTNDRIEQLSNNDFAERATKRHCFRIKHPGIGALWYHAVMNAVWKHIIGWDWKTKKGSPGLYGVPEAAMEGTEEQTRKRLHGHCLVWIKGAGQLLKDLQSKNECEMLLAKDKIIEIFDRTTSTTFLEKSSLPCDSFQHKEPCTKIRKQSRRKPSGVTSQQLRDMRHKVGKNEHKGIIARCNKCLKAYTVEDLVIARINHLNSITDTHNFDIDSWNSDVSMSGDFDNTLSITGKKKLEELLFLLSIPGNKRYPELSALVTNAVKNLHGDTHCKQCFKKGDECRYNLPKLPISKTHIKTDAEIEEWFDFLGNKSPYFLYNIEAKRDEYDVFQNQSCKAISLSKLGSNSNSQLCINGQMAMYVTKYPTKPNQKEDESEYEHVLHYLRLRLPDRRFEADCTEALSRAIGAILAHNSSNIVSAWLAKHLINQRSRFRFSHEIRDIPSAPIQDELLHGNCSKRLLKNYRGNFYIDSGSLQYIKRPASLEQESLTEFVLKYHIAKKNSNNEKNMIHYDCTEDEYGAAPYQGILRSKNNIEYIPGINIWGFQDAAKFEGSILDSSILVSKEMEHYAFQVLIHFCPFRTLDDLQVNQSYVLKFRQWYLDLPKNPETFSYVKRTLGNIQVLRNSFHIRRNGDSLSDCTDMFVDPDLLIGKKEAKLDYNKHKAYYAEECLKVIQSMIETETKSSYTKPFTDTSELSLLQLQKKGTWKCGFTNIVSMDERAKFFSIYSTKDSQYTEKQTTISREALRILQRLNKRNLVDVMLERTIRQHGRKRKIENSCEDMSSANTSSTTNTSTDISTTSQAFHIEANGTPESIYLWAMQAFGNDIQQRKAFEILAAKFVLGYCVEAEKNEDCQNTLTGMSRRHFLRCQHLLQEMSSSSTPNSQLVMFLTGPGGSGKSEIIKELLAYSEQFCSAIQQPFTKRTILVTACSGVAATLIHGQTLHSATFLNKNIQNIDKDDKLKFQNCVRMLVIDEISLLSGCEIRNLSKRLNWLMDNRSGVYGGIDIIFLGDFRQLTPVGKKPIYAAPVAEFSSYINCFISLQGQYRFKHDPAFGDICNRFRNGCPTTRDFITLNERIVSYHNPLPKNARVACKQNDEREAVNVATWLQYLTEHGEDKAFVILADNIEIRVEGAANMKLKDLTSFYSAVGEDDCQSHIEGKFTPMLRCYPRCPLMLTTNTDVGNNLANGTQGFCTGLVFQDGKQFHSRRINNMLVNCAYASEVKYLLWKVNNETVQIEPKMYSALRVQFPLPKHIETVDNARFTLHLKATQIPLISNNATTGHKLQGSSVDILYVPSWNYTVNWPYVVMSRVKTLKGLFLGRPLDAKKDYSVPPSLTAMLEALSARASPQHFNYNKLRIPSEYESLAKLLFHVRNRSF